MATLGPRALLPVCEYSSADRAAFIEKLAARQGAERVQTSRPCNILVFQNEYSDQALALRMKSRIDDLIFKLRVRIGDEFFSGGKVVLAYPAWNTVFQRTYRMNFLPHPKKSLGEGGSGSICALNAQRTFLKGYNEEKCCLGH